jgi:hypothetical protein
MHAYRFGLGIARVHDMERQGKGSRDHSAVFLTRLTAVVFSLRYSEKAKINKKSRNAPEAVLEPPGHVLQIAHPASAGCLSALCLLAPLIRAEFGCRVPALRACWPKGSEMEKAEQEQRTFVLPVEGAVAAATAESVRFGVSLTERRRSFCLQTGSASSTTTTPHPPR